MSFECDAHVCLVSDQPAANLIPALDPALGPKDKKIFLLVSTKMTKKADLLAKALKGHSFATEKITIKDPFDYGEIWEKLFEFLDKMPKNVRLALNMTGGTKIMALAAKAIFDDFKKPSFYVVNEPNFMALLMGGAVPKGQATKVKLKAGLNWHDYLCVYGFEAKDAVKPLSNARFINDLVAGQKKYERELGRLNARIDDKLNGGLTDAGTDDFPLAGVENIVKLCVEHDLASYLGNEVLWRFKDGRALEFVHGGWLEEYAYHALKADKIQGKKIGLTIVAGPEKVKNELDVTFMANDRLHIIECKTGRLDDGKGMQALDKLKNIKDRTGLKTKTMLASWRKLSDSIQSRAHEYGIKVLQKEQLLNIKSELEKWIAAP